MKANITTNTELEKQLDATLSDIRSKMEIIKIKKKELIEK